MSKMADRPKNLIADLMDLRSRIAPIDGSESYQIHSELRVGKALTEEPLGMVVASRAFVRLHLSGYEILPGNRLGEPVRAPMVEQIKTVSETTHQSSASAHAGVGLSTSGRAEANLGGKAGAAAASTVKTVRTAKSSETKTSVRALGGDRWEITPNGGDFLDLTFISDTDPLCRIQKSRGANMASVEVQGYVLRRDLEFVPDKKIPFLGPNKLKALNAFLVKKIGECAEGSGDQLVLSSQEIGDV
jgi:hypothetical protein